MNAARIDSAERSSVPGVVAAASLVVAVLLLALPAQAVAATPIAEFRANVSAAREMVDEVRGERLSEREAIDLAAEVNTLVPVRVEVATDDGVMTADNTIVRTLIAQLDAADTVAERTEVTEDLYAHLSSLEHSLGEPTDEPVPADAAALAELVSDSPGQVRNPITEFVGELIDRLVRAIIGWWESPSGSSASTIVAWIVRVVVFLGLALVLIVLGRRAYVAVRAALVRRAKGVDAPAISEEPIIEAARDVPEDVLAYADRCAAQGETREAVRALFGGAARTLQRRGYVIELRHATNQELLLEVRPRSEAAYVPLSWLSRLFEGAWYGRRPVDAEVYAEARDRYTRVLEAAPELAAGDAS